MVKIYYVNRDAKRSGARLQNDAVAPGQWLEYGAVYEVPAEMAKDLVDTGEWSRTAPGESEKNGGDE